MADLITGRADYRWAFVRSPQSGYFVGKPRELRDTLITVFRESGTAADKVDLLYLKTITFVASTAQVLDLSAAVGDDGITSNFARLRFLAARVRSTTDAAYLQFDNAGQATNPFLGFLNANGVLTVRGSTLAGDGTSIRNPGFFVISAPNTTGMLVGTGVNVRMLPSAHAFSVDLILAGCTA